MVSFGFDTMKHKKTTPSEILTYLRDKWFMKHLIEEDQKFSTFFKERGLK